MRSAPVEFFSEGIRLRGTLRLPDAAPPPAGYPALVHGPGFRGLASQELYLPWHEAFTAAGYAVLVFDYRGFGQSDGERGWLRPDWQVEDIVNAASYLDGRPDVDGRRLGAYGMGGTGGGNAIMAAALDSRLRAVCAQTAVADGAQWLHRLRRESEWQELRTRLRQDGIHWATEGSGEMVDSDFLASPAGVIRRTNGTATAAEPLYLRSAEFVMRYHPIDHISAIAPRAVLLTSLENDPIIPEDTVQALFHTARPPKKLVRQIGLSHYQTYSLNCPRLSAQFVDWYDRFLKPLAPEAAATEVITLSPPGEEESQGAA